MSSQRRCAGWRMLPGFILLPLFVAASAAATVVKNVVVEERGSATQITVEADGPIDYQDFLLSNPDRLVIDCLKSTSLLPPKGDAHALAGPIRAITSSQWNGKGGDSVARIVCELKSRPSYTVATRPNGLVVILEGGGPAAGGIGYDEDRMASKSTAQGTRAPAASQEESGPAAAAASRSEARDAAGGEQAANDEEQGRGAEEAAATEPGASQEVSAAESEESAEESDEEYEADDTSGSREEASRPVFIIQPKVDAQHYSSRAFGSASVGERIEDRPQYLDPASAKRVSLDVQRAAVQTVVRTLAQISGRNIVSNQEVGGQVTVRLNDIPWPQALDIVLLTQGLGFTDEEGVLRIASLEKLRTEQLDRETAARKQEELRPLETRVVPVNFAKAEEVKPALDKLFTARGHAEVDKRTNSIIITDIGERVSMAQSLVSQLDTRTPQVEIESKLVDLDVSDTRDLGIDWTARTSDDGEDLEFRSINPIASSAGEIRVGVANPDLDLNATLQALAESRKANIISNPRISTVNNREASILVGQEIPLIVQDQSFNTVIQLKKIGIKLTVRPHINADQQIELDVHPEVSDLASQATVQGGIIINTSEADTRILVNDGETAVIGGLIRENESTRVRGIPILKDIPALGWLFRSESKIKQKRELLIFITPRIVKA